MQNFQNFICIFRFIFENFCDMYSKAFQLLHIIQRKGSAVKKIAKVKNWTYTCFTQPLIARWYDSLGFRNLSQDSPYGSLFMHIILAPNVQAYLFIFIYLYYFCIRKGMLRTFWICEFPNTFNRNVLLLWVKMFDFLHFFASFKYVDRCRKVVL